MQRKLFFQQLKSFSGLKTFNIEPRRISDTEYDKFVITFSFYRSAESVIDKLPDEWKTNLDYRERTWYSRRWWESQTGRLRIWEFTVHSEIEEGYMILESFQIEQPWVDGKPTKSPGSASFYIKMPHTDSVRVVEVTSEGLYITAKV